MCKNGISRIDLQATDIRHEVTEPMLKHAYAFFEIVFTEPTGICRLMEKINLCNFQLQICCLTKSLAKLQFWEARMIANLVS